jgi:hypothetical protein
MKRNPKITKLGLAALVGYAALTGVGLSAANAAAHYYEVPSQLDGGPYHQDRLPDGTLTGPIAPDANGG